MLSAIKKMKTRWGTALLALLFSLSVGSAAVLKAEAAKAPAAPAKPAPIPLTNMDFKALAGPAADAMAKGDPAGAITGTINDVPVSDTTTGMTLSDVVGQVGQNKVAIN